MTVTDEEDKHPDGVGEEGRRGRETQVTVISFVYDKSDHVMWRGNGTRSDNNTTAHSMTKTKRCQFLTRSSSFSGH